MRVVALILLTPLTVGFVGCGRAPTTPAGPPARAEFVLLYVSLLGSDSSSGSFESPLATLAGAQTRIIADNADCDYRVRIRADQGKYPNQHVVWTWTRPGRSITFEGFPAGQYATFEHSGCASDSVFFRLLAAGSYATRLTFTHLIVRGYNAGAIWFSGGWPESNGWNGGNVIEDCVFENIGNVDDAAVKVAYGIVDFVESRRNTVAHCVFRSCANFTGFTTINAIYISHGSNGNLIYGNTFQDVLGSPVRFRDQSDSNEVYGNDFGNSRGEAGVVTSWFCWDKPPDGGGGDGPFPEPPSGSFGCFRQECPSHYNRIHDNVYCCSVIRLGGFYFDMQPFDSNYVLQGGCFDPTPGARVTLSDNRRCE